MLLRTLMILILCLTVRVHADSLVPEHDKYTQTYQSDWSKLPTGEVLAKHDVSKISFKEANGEDVRQYFDEQEKVHLKDLHYKVKWNQKNNKSKTTLILIENVNEVILENISILNTDPDYKAYDSIRVEGADRVIIRNLYLAGTVQSYHLRLEGCGEILIENVEIAGIQ